MVSPFLPLFLCFCTASYAHPATTASLQTLKTVNASSPAVSSLTTQVTPGPEVRAVAPSPENMFLTTATGDWKTVTCDDPGLIDNTFPGKTRWDAAHVAELWSQLIDSYNQVLQNKDTRSSEQTFDSFFTNNVHEADFLECWDYSSLLCSDKVTCEETTAPAVWLIENSMVVLHTYISSSFSKLLMAYNDVSANMDPFAETFTSFPKKGLADNIFKTILDTVNFVIGIGSAFAWNVIIKKAALFADDNYRGAWKDVTNAAVAYSIVASKDNKIPADTPRDLVPVLTSGLYMVFDNIANAQAAFLQNTVQAEDEENQKVLTNLLANGSMLELAKNDNGLHWKDMIEIVKDMYYGSIIPLAWELSPVKQRPFILRVDREQYKCGDEIKEHEHIRGFNLGNYMTQDTAKKTRWCDDEGNSWFLLSGNHPDSCHKNPSPRTGFCTGPAYHSFTALPGGDNENLARFSNITIADIVKSSWGGFLANDRSNGYSFSVETSVALEDDMQSVKATPFPLFDGITTPGFFNFTICLDAEEAFNRVWNKEEEICPKKPSEKTLNPPENALGYTQGWCNLHITQWPMGKDSKGTNPFDKKWELAVAIKDAAGKLIAQATKQPVDPSFIIKSNLPQEVAVAIGSDNAKEKQRICFWYSDQHWCTEGGGPDAVADRCQVGKFGDGKREMDCGFQCSAPSDDIPSTPRVDITKDAPIAFMGTGDDPEIIGTAKSYKPGWCGVHIRHYQKTENNNFQNPSQYYALEVTIYDAEHNIIDYLDKTYAPEGVHLHAQGPLPWQLVLWTGAVDDDPIYMAYGADSWDSKEGKRHFCKQGKYDSGMRQMDCGFSC